jgi:hypothetical protein
MGKTALPGLDEDAHVAAFEAADFVIKNRTVSARRSFTELYERLVGFIAAHRSYASDANKAFASPDPENTDQKKVFAGVLAKQ